MAGDGLQIRVICQQLQQVVTALGAHELILPMIQEIIPEVSL
jgi:hypothetical protein